MEQLSLHKILYHYVKCTTLPIELNIHLINQITND